MAREIFINNLNLVIIMILVFDLSGVFFNNGLKVAVKKISEEFNLNSDKVNFVLNGTFAEKYRTGLISLEEFWIDAERYLKIDNIDEIKKIFFESYQPHQESVKLLKFLRAKNYKLAYLSNNPKDRSEFLNKKYNFISLFDFGLFSFEAHVRKPNIKIYEKFLEKFDLNPKEIIYIDDGEKNLIPAKEVGMKTILFQDIDLLKIKLKELGLDI